MPKGNKNDRLEVRFDPETLHMWPADVQRRRDTNRIRATVLHYVDNPVNRTPTGGTFRSQRFAVRIDGRKWVGQTKKGTDIVRLRPADDD